MFPGAEICHVIMMLCLFTTRVIILCLPALLSK
jgi:hypothetical protein